MAEPYSPFFYRPRDDTDAKYAWVAARQKPVADINLAIGRRVFPSYAHLSYADHLSYAMHDILEGELDFIEPPHSRTLDDYIVYRNRLNKQHYFLENERHFTTLLEQAMIAIFGSFANLFPDFTEPSPFSVPLIHIVPNPAELIEALMFELASWKDKGVLKGWYEKVNDNYLALKEKLPTESKLQPQELVKAYLHDTPFEALFLTSVPLALTRDDRMSHMHVIGGTGAGKTTLIEHLIMHDLRSPNPPSIVLIDPHSDLVNKLVTSDIGIDDRLIYINPRHIEHPPALNVFAPSKRYEHYDEATKEQVSAGVIQTLEYLFSGFGIEMTGKQQVLFRNCARLMLALPESMGRNATILDLMRVMDDPKPYQKAIDGLPPIPQEFFKKDFNSKTFQQTKEQIRYRLQAILENPTIARLFTSEENKVDLFDALNNGSLILVDAAKDFLKTASPTFGRIFISLVLQAVLERAVIDAGKRRDAFLIVDEAGSFFSDNIDDLLVEARKYRCGLLLAHQYLEQATPSLRASLSANTAIKMASGLSAADARNMSADMRTTQDFILSQPKLHFACHIRDVTGHAVSVALGFPEDLPMVSREQLALRLEANRERVTKTRTPVRNPIGFGVDLQEVEEEERYGRRIGFHDDF